MRFLGKGLALVLLWSLVAAVVWADQKGQDYPHNSVTGSGCSSCHYMQSGEIPDWVTALPEDIDDTPYNNLCWSCHNGVDASGVDTHSSLTSSTQYGAWSMECRVCHWPHQQRQLRAYGADSYLLRGVSTEVTTFTLKKAGAGWQVDAYKGMMLIPDTTPTGNKYTYQYKITGNTSDTITVKIQFSIWRNNGAANIGVSGSPAGLYNAPSAEASLALCINPLNLNGGSSWKPVLAGNNFTIGTSRSSTTSNLFNGLIDWVKWKDVVD